MNLSLLRANASWRPAAVALSLAAAVTAATAAVPLPSYNIDPSQITVSGLSSGGFMANQLGYAYSATFRGVGVFAAGPYMCAGHSPYTSCMYNAPISATMLGAMQVDIDRWSGSAIDDKSHVAAQKVFLFVGTADATVGPNPVIAARNQYASNGVPAAHLEFVQRSGAAHVFPTDFDAPGNNNCSSSASPYIANCGYDGAKAVLSRLYGTLNPRNDAPAGSNYIEFDQTAFTTNPGMAPTGWVYVPANCAAGQVCRLHVALHGCQQNTATIGDRFVRNTGYSRWADTNNIVVLFPQTRVDNISRSTAASGLLPNPNGCWDWIGWYGGNFAQKGGAQMSAIKAMVATLSSGGSGTPGTLPAPQGLTASSPAGNAMTLSWQAVSGAAGYHVYRSGAKVTSAPVAATTFTDTGLAPATTYSWTVRALDANGGEGAAASPVSATTTGSAAACFTASNYAHTVAGRAYQSGGFAFARGSNQNMGFWNIYLTTTLKRTAPDYYVIGACS